jgi:hypothetical protein
MLQISAAKMGWARRSKIVSKNSKNSCLSYGVKIFREREWSGWWRGKWRVRGPHIATARPGPGRATMWCGGMVGPPWGVPGASLPQIWHKNLKRIFWNSSRNFIFEDFHKLTKD